MMLVSVDFANAFNDTSRMKSYQEIVNDPEIANMTRLVHWAYSGSSSLFISDEKAQTRILSSESGARQGCNLGMALFCAGINNIYKKVRDTHKVDLKAYADDPPSKAMPLPASMLLICLNLKRRKNLALLRTNTNTSSFFLLPGPLTTSLKTTESAYNDWVDKLSWAAQRFLVSSLVVTSVKCPA